MKNQIKKIVYHPLFAASFVMIIGNNLVNALNYFYHLIMGRLLGPSVYGELATLLSLISLVAMLPASLSLTIVKFISSSKSESEIKGLVSFLAKWTFLFSLLLAFLMAISSFTLTVFFKISDIKVFFLIAATLLFLLPVSFNRSVLHGLLKFKEFIITIIIDNGLKLILGVLFVALGLSLFGAIGALLIGIFIGWIISKLFILKLLNTKGEANINLKPMIKYSLPVLVHSVAITSLYSLDLILVKHFFSSHQAGIYAALSMLGRIIYFGAGPISAVMFPMISQRHSKGEKYNKIFLYSFIMTLGLCLFMLFLYLVFPSLAVSILYGSSYLEATSLLIWFGVFMSFFTLSALLINFHLSLGQTKVVIFPAIAAIIQAVAIWFYHNSLYQVVMISILVTALLLVSLFVYFVYETKINLRHSTSL